MLDLKEKSKIIIEKIYVRIKLKALVKKIDVRPKIKALIEKFNIRDEGPRIFKIESSRLCLFLCLLILTGSMYISQNPNGFTIADSDVHAASVETKPKLIFNLNIGVPVLCYHKIATADKLADVPNNMVVTPQELEEQIASLKAQGYVSISFEELYDYMANKKPIPEKSIVLSFDDGFQSNYVYLPTILKKYHMKAEIALVTGSTRRAKGEVTNGASYFTWGHAKELQDNGSVFLESHTANHVNLAKWQDLQNELQGSSNDILQYTGKRPIAIVYPGGSYNDETIKTAKSCGYKMGVGIDWGINYCGGDTMKVKRLIVNHGDTGAKILERIEKYKRK